RSRARMLSTERFSRTIVPLVLTQPTSLLNTQLGFPAIDGISLAAASVAPSLRTKSSSLATTRGCGITFSHQVMIRCQLMHLEPAISVPSQQSIRSMIRPRVILMELEERRFPATASSTRFAPTVSATLRKTCWRDCRNQHLRDLAQTTRFLGPPPSTRISSIFAAITLLLQRRLFSGNSATLDR